jgi:DNA primase catalytic subunit
MEEKSENEKRIRALTRLYYSNPKIQEVLLKFGKDREVVPRYFEGFGKRPDTLQYSSDILGLVQKGATSFHASEELWNDALQLSSEITQEQMHELRKGWDLLIDIDSKYLDFSKIAAVLLIEQLEQHGIKNYGIKFSGSKGFHIIISEKAFPREYNGNEMKKMFPEWPRAICEYLMNKIRQKFSRETHNISNIQALELRTNKKREQLLEIVCPECGRPVNQDKWITLKCGYCSNEIKQKKSAIAKKRVLRCQNCLSEMDIINEEDFFECLDCKITNISKLEADDSKNIKYTKDAKTENIVEMSHGLQEEHTGGFDLVLVAPRHLFRMPYSLHEKTSLASVVLKKEQLNFFSPKDADPLKIKVSDFYPDNEIEEARELLAAALDWKKNKDKMDEKTKKKYASSESYAETDFSSVKEEMFPASIKKLLKGLKEGKKRGLFILITFLKALGFQADYINSRVREWNKLNEPPLKEGYVRGQVDWHLKRKKKILPPNYDNQSFYADLGLLDKKPDAKNPIVEVSRLLRKNK